MHFMLHIHQMVKKKIRQPHITLMYKIVDLKIAALVYMLHINIILIY